MNKGCMNVGRESKGRRNEGLEGRRDGGRESKGRRNGGLEGWREREQG